MTDQQQSLFFGARDASTYAPGVGTIAPVAGTYTLTGWGNTTPSINWNDNNTTIQGYVDLLNGIQVLSLNGATGGSLTLTADSYTPTINVPCTASDIDNAFTTAVGSAVTTTTDMGSGNFKIDASALFANDALTPTLMTFVDSTTGGAGITIVPYPYITTTAITNGFTFDMGGEFAGTNQSVMTIDTTNLLQDASSVTVTVTQAGVADTPTTVYISTTQTAIVAQDQIIELFIASTSAGTYTLNTTYHGSTVWTFANDNTVDPSTLQTAMDSIYGAGNTSITDDSVSGYYLIEFIGSMADQPIEIFSAPSFGVTLYQVGQGNLPQIDTITFSNLPSTGQFTFSGSGAPITCGNTASDIATIYNTLVSYPGSVTGSGSIASGTVNLTYSDYGTYTCQSIAAQSMVYVGCPQIMTIVENDSPTAGNVGFFVNGTQSTQWVYNDSGSGVASGVSTASGQTYTCSGTAGNWTVTSSVDYYDSNTYTGGSDTTTPAPLTKACPAELDITTFLNFCSGGVAVGGTATLGSPGLDCVGGCKVGGHTSISYFIDCHGGVKTGGLTTHHKHLIIACSGGVKTGGLTTNHKHLIVSCSGGVKTGGLTTHHKHLILSCSGGVKTGGTALTSGSIDCHGGCRIGSMPFTKKRTINLSSGVVLNNFVLQLYIPNSGNNAVFFNPINGKRYLSKNIADEFYHVKVDLQNENILVNY